MAGTAKGFSKNVLNMKFMKQAEKRAEEIEDEQLENKLKDLSEWRTSDADKLKKKAQSKPKVSTVGFAAINSLNNGSPLIGRRTFGETKKEESKETKQEDEGDDLNKLWQKQKEEKNERTGIKREKGNKYDSPKNVQNKKRKSTN